MPFLPILYLKCVTDLVLDLRYNLGGRGSTATILASLIKGTSTSDLLFRTIYNVKNYKQNSTVVQQIIIL